MLIVEVLDTILTQLPSNGATIARVGGVLFTTKLSLSTSASRVFPPRSDQIELSAVT